MQAPEGRYGVTLRRLHLAIACFVLSLAVTGFLIYFRKPLGLQPHKLTLVWTHAIIAYAFLAVLALRAYRGFFGPAQDRFRVAVARVSDCQRFFFKGDAMRTRFKFAGRSPLSRMLATIIYATLAVNAATGLVRAGTDIYLPPFGPIVRAYVSADNAPLLSVRPSDRTNVDQQRFDFISRAKIPFGKIHIYGAFIIVTAAAIHGLGAALTEWSAPNDRTARGRARLMLFGPRGE